jgi:ESS family glutamate:Na+ symporter
MNTPFPFDGMLVFAFLSALLLAGVGVAGPGGILPAFSGAQLPHRGRMGLVLMHSGLLHMETTTPSRPLPIIFSTFRLFPWVDAERQRQRPGGKNRDAQGAGLDGADAGAHLSHAGGPGRLLVILLGWFGVGFFPPSDSWCHWDSTKVRDRPCPSVKCGRASGFADAATIGLTFAAVGYFCAFFIGVPLVNRGIRKGQGHLRSPAASPGFSDRGV